MGNVFSSQEGHLSFVSTSVTATAPPVSSFPTYNVPTDNALRNRNTETHFSYLIGFECLMDVEFFCIQKRFSGCGFPYRFDIVVTNERGRQILQVEQLEEYEKVSRHAKKRLQCNDLSGRPLFFLSRYLRDPDGINLPPAQGEFLGYIDCSQSAFCVMNNRQEVVIKSSLDFKEISPIERHLSQVTGPRKRETVGTLLADSERIVISFSKVLDIALKACIIATAIDSLLPKEK